MKVRAVLSVCMSEDQTQVHGKSASEHRALEMKCTLFSIRVRFPYIKILRNWMLKKASLQNFQIILGASKEKCINAVRSL